MGRLSDAWMKHADHFCPSRRNTNYHKQIMTSVDLFYNPLAFLKHWGDNLGEIKNTGHGNDTKWFNLETRRHFVWVSLRQLMTKRIISHLLCVFKKPRLSHQEADYSKSVFIFTIISCQETKTTRHLRSKQVMEQETCLGAFYEKAGI